MFTDLTYFCCYWNDVGVFKLRIFQCLPQPFFHLKHKKKKFTTVTFMHYLNYKTRLKHPNLRMPLKSVSNV